MTHWGARFLMLLPLTLAVGCSVLTTAPLCGHPTCIAHLALDRAQAEIPLGPQARTVSMLGPVGRAWEVSFDQATASPLIFEDGRLVGWCHAFPREESVLQDPNLPFRELHGLSGGEDAATVERRRGRADKVVRFHNEAGEAVQLWSWYGADLLLVLTRELAWDELDGQWQLATELSLCGYGEGFGDYRARR